MKRNYPLAAVLAFALCPSPLMAATQFSGGFWANFQYIDDNDTEEDTIGTVNSEALVAYIDHQTDDGQWSFSSEIRFGPGAFTDPNNNSTGDNIAIHKGWVRYNVSDTNKVYIGKSAVPFGWKTVNFWPGDMFQAGYGDQMDVGVKWTRDAAFDTALAYFHADDWGSSSTDSTDDNGHWGSKETYRKVQTLVGDIKYPLSDQHTLGFSAQIGKLQDQSAVADSDDSVSGKHHAWVMYYLGEWGAFSTKAEIIGVKRELPDEYAEFIDLEQAIKNQRAAIEVGYSMDQWFFYLDATYADTDTKGNGADLIQAYAPGFSYDFGPGWIYLELLHQDGYIDRNGMVNEGDFRAIYVSIDYYF